MTRYGSHAIRCLLLLVSISPVSSYPGTKPANAAG
jgi:hypothetical protein